MVEKLTFEEKYDVIVKEIEKRRYQWTLKAISWLDFDDVIQIILLHIYKKWDLWDQSKEFLPWLNTVITRQIINLLRNLYMNVARPCISLNCAANEGDNRCRLYGKQCAKCPLYATWEKTRKVAYDVKLPVSIEDHAEKVYELPGNDENIEGKAEYIHQRMKEILTPIQYKIYKYLYIDGRSETEAAQLMGYRTSEKHRMAGYRQIQNMKKIFVEKAKKIIYRELS
jgi:RNA polymerase sigma factor (sigma-70 family)